MKLIINKDEFLKKLTDVQGAIETKESATPILSHFLLVAKKKGSIIQATDLHTYLREPIEANVEEEGKICLPAKKLLEIVKELDGDIRLEADDANWMKIIGSGSKFKVAGLPSKDFPKWPTPETSVKVSITTPMLLEILQKTLFAAGDDDKRFVLNGLLLHVKPNEEKLTFAATNGHRLACIERRPTSLSEVKEEIKAIMPKKSVTELKKFLVGEGEIECHIAPDHIIFTIGPLDFMVRLLAGTYPDYRAIVPSHANGASLDRVACTRAIRRASLMSTNTHIVKMDLTNGKATVTSAVPDLGEAIDEIPVEYEGDSLSLGINSKYLLEALSGFGEKLNFKLGKALEPILIRDNVDQEYFYILMPARV